MANYCEDCGCRTSGGVCSNCQEELYIVNEQADCIDQPLSAEFRQRVDEQTELLKLRKQQNENA
jgi:hypothetical protein